MGHRIGILLLPLVLCCSMLASAGCIAEVTTSPAVQTILTPSPSPSPESPIVPVSISGLSLQREDLPSGYILKDRTMTAYAATGQIFRDLGWQQGYRVSYYRMDKNTDDITYIIQDIEIYPSDTVKDVYSLRKEVLLPAEESSTGYQVPFPVTGDRSVAWREVRVSGTVPIVVYTVIFTKKNVYEEITMTGTTTDYELLRELVATAARKIR